MNYWYLMLAIAGGELCYTLCITLLALGLRLYQWKRTAPQRTACQQELAQLLKYVQDAGQTESTRPPSRVN